MKLNQNFQGDAGGEGGGVQTKQKPLWEGFGYFP